MHPHLVTCILFGLIYTHIWQRLHPYLSYFILFCTPSLVIINLVYPYLALNNIPSYL